MSSPLELIFQKVYPHGSNHLDEILLAFTFPLYLISKDRVRYVEFHSGAQYLHLAHRQRFSSSERLH